MITGPLRDRFGVVSRLDYYSDEELREILVRSALVLGVSAADEGIHEIGRRSRGDVQRQRRHGEQRRAGRHVPE